MTILLTGVSSFTGYWLARELVERGARVCATLTRPQASYKGIRAERLRRLQDRVTFLEGVGFGDDVFCQTIESEGVEVVVAHGAKVEGYRAPGFAYLDAVAANTQGVEQVVGALARVDGTLVVTGSVFEADEGLGSDDRRAFSEYGLSKTLTWQVFRFFAVRASVPLVKVVIPNPFGPLEDERFVAYLFQTWRRGEVAEVKTPQYVRDNIHVQWLAAAYADACLKRPHDGIAVMRPSGYIESQGMFARRVAFETGTRIGWECPVTLAEQQSFDEPLVRINSDPVWTSAPRLSEARCWDALVEWYMSRQ